MSDSTESAELEALRAFHRYFRDRCEGLFERFGMGVVDLYNAAAQAGREAQKKGLMIDAMLDDSAGDNLQ